eukprot:5289661-Amphidinium_carterae.1
MNFPTVIACQMLVGAKGFLQGERWKCMGKTYYSCTLQPLQFGARMVVGGMDGNVRFFDFAGMNEQKEAFRMVEPVEGHMVQ